MTKLSYTASGKCSHFGGDDPGVDDNEGLAFIYEKADKKILFVNPPRIDPSTGLPYPGLAKQLNSEEIDYVACRWPYDADTKPEWTEALLTDMALVTAPSTGKFIKCWPSDWGPHEEKTEGRVADLSKHAMQYLFGTTDATDQIVEVIWPFTERGKKPALPFYETICISSGHGLYVRGASGIIDEVDEARIVVEALASALRERGVEVLTFHDDTSHDQSTNLHTITEWHNSQGEHDLDLSVHFNAFEQRAQGVGVEMWWVSQLELATQLSAAVAKVGLIDRGAKEAKGEDSLWFLDQTIAPAVLCEICFVDSETDCRLYAENLDMIISNMADVLSGGPEHVSV